MLFDEILNHLSEKVFFVKKEQYTELAKAKSPPPDLEKRKKFNEKMEDYIEKLLQEIIK